MGPTLSWTNIELEKHIVGKTSSGKNIDFDKHRIGQKSNSTGQKKSRTNTK